MADLYATAYWLNESPEELMHQTHDEFMLSQMYAMNNRKDVFKLISSAVNHGVAALYGKKGGK